MISLVIGGMMLSVYAIWLAAGLQAGTVRRSLLRLCWLVAAGVLVGVGAAQLT